MTGLADDLFQVAKDRKEVFEQEERERKATSESSDCDNTIEHSDDCHQDDCGIWSFWCIFG